MWDGTPVVWREWDRMVAFLCPPRVMEPCEVCGERGQPATALGTTGTRFRPIHLQATRCPHCDHDQVINLDDGTVWDLDESDYTDEGSWAVAQA